MQTFLTSPKFEKKYLYKSPTLLYHEFCNAWAYQKMVKLSNPNLPKQQLLEEANTKWTEIKKNDINEIKNIINSYLTTPVPLARYGFQVSNFRNSQPTRPFIQETAQIRSELNEENQISQNATAQRYTISEKERAQKKVAEYTTMLDMATDSSMRTHLVNQINTEKQVIPRGEGGPTKCYTI
ncbi:unnamed protein product [Rhizophagus irregularis]|nr:unnamed protein product [Rhizophagus irregularis]